MIKKRLLIIAGILSFASVASPVTAYASGMNVIAEGNGYVVLGGQGMDSLQGTLEGIGEYIGIGNICSSLPETPEKPETPEQPEMPETPEGSNQPDNGLEEESEHPYITRILELVNEERTKAGLAPLELDMSITAAATVRAREIRQSFSHTRPNGSSFSTALTEQGVSYRGSGENIAWGQKTPEQVMNGWMNSDGHRANILNKNFKNLGVGYYQDEHGVNYWVQLFTY